MNYETTSGKHVNILIFKVTHNDGLARAYFLIFCTSQYYEQQVKSALCKMYLRINHRFHIIDIV